MNESALRQILGRLSTPPLDDAAREKALYRAELAFANRSASPAPARRQEGTAWMKKALAMGFVAMGIAGLVGLQMARPSGEPLAEGKLLAEMEALFPGQLDGVVSSGNDVSLELAPTASASTRGTPLPLALTFQRGQHVVRVLGYSGRKVCVNLGGRKRCMEPLVTAEGKVIVDGDDFLWTDAQPRPVAGYRLQASTLSF